MALTVEGGKLVTQVLVNPGTVFTVAFIGYDNSGVGQDVIEFKNFNAVHTNVKDGVFTYNYPAKENYTYNVLLIKSRFTAKDYANYGGYIPDNVILEYDTISTLSKLEFAAKPGSATSDSITILQKSGTQLQTLDNLVFSAKFNGARTATQYTVNGNQLVDANGDPACSINLNEDGSITISDLQANSKQSFQIAQTGENAISAYSSKLTISTTKEQKAAPTDVIATINEAGEATVTWNGDTSDKYTVLYTCTDSKGNVKTKVLTKNASVNVEGTGKFTTGKLLSGSKYTFSVYTNKGDNLDASVYVNSNEVITPTIVPAPQLKKIGNTDKTATFQIANWDKMESALQEVGEGQTGASVTIRNGENVVATFVYTQVETEDGETYAWANSSDESTSTMVIVSGAKKNTAQVTITGLEASTNYSFTAEVSSDVHNENIAGVLNAKSKVLKVKTAITAYEPVDNLEATNPTSSSMDVSWTASEQQNKFIVTATPVSGTGKTITKTVSSNQVTITGMKPNTEYNINVVVKADKNGSQSETKSTTAQTLDNFDLINVTKLAGNQYALDFGVDMTKYSGRLDFTVSGSGKAYNPNDKKWHSDSVSGAVCSLFFGDGAAAEAEQYKAAHPNVSVLILEGDQSTCDLHVVTKKNLYNLAVTTTFVRTENNATLEFAFTTEPGVHYKADGSVKLTGGEVVNNETGVRYTARTGKTLQGLHFEN